MAVLMAAVWHGPRPRAHARVVGRRRHRHTRGRFRGTAFHSRPEPAPNSPRTARDRPLDRPAAPRSSEEHTSELQSLMRISYSGFCLKKKIQKPTNNKQPHNIHNQTEI